MLTLYHLAVSHYSEKARWALEFKGLDARSRQLTPGLHVLHTRWLGGNGTVPVLRDSETGATIADSTDILHYLERIRPLPPLFPDDDAAATRVSEVEEQFDATARHVSRFLYHHVLDHPAVLRAAWSAGLPTHRRLLVRVLVPLLVTPMRRARRIDAQTARESRERVLAALDCLQEMVREQGAGYLVGGRFSAADLTAASVLAPAVRPPGSPWDPGRRAVPQSPGFPPSEMTAFLREVGAHPAAEWVGRIWRLHRHRASARSTIDPGCQRPES